MVEKDIESHKKLRRVTKASLTKPNTKLTELEADATNLNALPSVQGLASKRKALDTEFKTHQLAIIMTMASLRNNKSWMITMTASVN